MIITELFKKYLKRMRVEAAIKSAILSIITACTIGLIPALIFYFQEYNGILTVLLSVFSVLTLSFCLFYFVAFKVNKKNVAKRIDSLGLDERAITMLELADDQSFMAQKQRENAAQKIASKRANELKIKVLKIPAIIAFALMIALSASATLMVANAYVEPVNPEIVNPDDGGDENDDEKTPDTGEIIDDMLEDLEKIIDESELTEGEKQELKDILEDFEKEIEDITDIDDLLDKLEKLKEDIEDATPPEEMSEEMKERIEEAMKELEEEQEDGEPSDEEPTDEEPGGEQEGDVEDPNGDDKKGDGDEEGDNPAPPKPNDEENLESEKIVDGTVPYRELLEQMYNEAMEILASGGEISDELREIIEAYYDIIA